MLARIKVGNSLAWVILDFKGFGIPYKLTKSEKAMEAASGWPRKLPDIGTEIIFLKKRRVNEKD